VGRKKYTQLNSNAVPSSDSIEPAVYVYDLYGVLGLNRSSPVKDLKQAYLSIAFSNHPDRNSSLDALYLYQNASHAYSVLVRDPEKKRQYDLKYGKL
jgi:DnaJ-class molecular chaperone